MSFNLLTSTLAVNPCQSLSHQTTGDSEVASQHAAAHELVVWLAALPSYFDLKNHPLCDGDREKYFARDYAPETRIVQQALRRCLHLCLLEIREPAPSLSVDDRFTLGDAKVGIVDAPLSRHQMHASAPMWEGLCELYLYCNALTRSSKVEFVSWMGLYDAAIRVLERFDSSRLSCVAQPEGPLPRLLSRIKEACDSTAARAGAGEVSVTLSLFAQCLEQLSFVGELLAKDRPIKLTLPIFAHVSATARAAASLLEGMARRAAESGGELYELYDSAGYAVRMELNKVFSRELVGLASSHLAPAIYTRVENAHGLLRDCFQQTIITLAQALDPSLDAATVFDTQLTKLQNSLRLREELWTLSELIKRAERGGGKPLAPLVARLQDFQQGAMRHLMYKDWESFERFVAEISAARGAVELGPVLHRFATYLDALFNQINMRVALADHPFTPPPLAD
ncbi:MAG: hypothetical protein QOE33_2858 [Acidobacteriota bacterium]|nr:hypothetical protein [Acidobacteriota bacterium]